MVIKKQDFVIKGLVYRPRKILIELQMYKINVTK